MARSSPSRPKPGRARTAADGDEDLVGLQLALGAVGAGQAQRALREAQRRAFEMNLDAELGQTPRDRRGQLGVVERQHAVERLDDRHLDAELGEGHAELQADIAGADTASVSGSARSASASVEEITSPPNGSAAAPPAPSRSR